MFSRPHHQMIAVVLSNFDASLLARAECYFGGGTAIALSLGEYRESIDIDFLCSSQAGFSMLRNAVTNELGPLLTSPMKHMREVRVERDKISTFLEVSGKPIKIEFIKEGNTGVTGALDDRFGIPTLSRVDMYTQKLLANADRGMDKVFMSRDIIDLAMMIDGWGEIPSEAWHKAYAAYGPYLVKGFQNAIGLSQDASYLTACMGKMGMDPALLPRIQSSLEASSTRIPVNDQSPRTQTSRPRP